MKYFYFSILITRLIYHLLGFIALILVKTKKQLLQSFLVTIALVLSLLTLSVTFLIKKQADHQQTEIIKQQQIKLSEEKKLLLKIIEKQPTHRDTLIQLSLISCQLEEWGDCQKFFHQAKKQDPNNPFFDNFSPFLIEQK